MPLEDAALVELRVAESGGGQRGGPHVVERTGAAADPAFQRDQVVDELGRGDRTVERDRDHVAVAAARRYAERRARSGERVDEVGANVGIGDGDGPSEEHDAASLRMNDAQVRRALVIAVGRNAAWVVPDGEREPLLAQFRKTERRDVFAPGDRVVVRRLDEERVVIDAVEPRTFALVRKTPGGRTKTMAANVDTLAITAAVSEPPPNLTMIDGLIAFAVQHDVTAALILTKPDLAPAEGPRLGAIYEPLGVAIAIVNGRTGAGVEALRGFLDGRHALLVGNSGVGKSTLFRALGGTATVGEVSRYGRGRQTTTSARLFQTAGGFLIDSPGIGEFALDPLPAPALARLFVELREPATRCRFADCRHLSEPDCAVREAAAAGTIAPSRYASYRALASAPEIALHTGREV